MRKSAVKRGYTKKLAYCGIMTAITVALSQLAFPLPSGVPVTMQTFAVSLCGFFGGLWGCAALLIYLLLGMAGVPVFANFKGGIGALVGPTGGFLLGFIPMVLLCAVRFKTKNNALNGFLTCLFGTIGVAALHIMGTAWFSVLSGNGFFQSLAIVSLPYLIKDIISVVGAYFAARLIGKKVEFPACVK